ncbi:hypothetical protein HW555_011397 [Spodoptera exigua]|uniref:Uncharacterized protein n=1 Tax=Spodoptera exigua TaxID=7107 RepID=A0A835G8Z2_SPOEX|nr:hypothetical protein HW555_011397 [Spodoptera exigua]
MTASEEPQISQMYLWLGGKNEVRGCSDRWCFKHADWVSKCLSNISFLEKPRKQSEHLYAASTYFLSSALARKFFKASSSFSNIHNIIQPNGMMKEIHTVELVRDSLVPALYTIIVAFRGD